MKPTVCLQFRSEKFCKIRFGESSAATNAIATRDARGLHRSPVTMPTARGVWSRPILRLRKSANRPDFQGFSDIFATFSKLCVDYMNAKKEIPP
ncbi:MAG: hypothetical protein ACI9TB_000539 [Parasphingorhabdus sp.]|jgi:hypothetical protein